MLTPSAILHRLELLCMPASSAFSNLQNMFHLVFSLMHYEEVKTNCSLKSCDYWLIHYTTVMLDIVHCSRYVSRLPYFMRFDFLTTVGTRWLSGVVLWVVATCGFVGRYQRFGGVYYQRMEAVCSTDTRLPESTLRYKPEDRHRYLHFRENLMSLKWLPFECHHVVC
jgi:hypothetical protein